MKLIKNIKRLSLAVAIALPASYISAKTFDPDLALNIAQSDALELHQVIVTFNSTGGPSVDQLSALEALGVTTGVSLQRLPIAGVLATKQQIDAIYARDDVVSVWNNDQLTLENYESTQITGVQDLRADQSLRNNGIPYSGRGIGVVINDSGVDGLHSDLMFPSHVKQNVLAQTNLHSFSDLLPITYQEDTPNTDIGGGHGTHVAGTVGGNGAMSSGKHAGVAPGADIIGYGSGAALFILDTLGGFDYALTHQYTYNIRVISNSFGNTGDVGTDFAPDDPTNIATKALADNGIITVFSAGNSGSGESTITGNFKKAPWVITVAAGDKEGNLADFSSRGVKGGEPKEVTVDGEVFTWEDRPTITAPGVDVISARASTSSLGGLSAQDDAEMIEPQNLAYYTVSSGTSMAAPHVSGIVSLILEADPTLTWREVKSIVQLTATPMSGYEPWEAGAGYINAHAAVKAVIDGAEAFGDTVKLNRDFNAEALVEEGRELSRTVSYVPVGEPPAETFEVFVEDTLVLASATIETGIAFVLEDPLGNRYGSGIGLIALGSSVGTVAPGVAGTWKVYASGIGSISGVSVDPVGVTNGIGVPMDIDVSIRTLQSAGYEGLDDIADHPAQSYIEYVVGRQLMDAKADGFKPDDLVTRLDLAKTMTLAASLRQTLDGNQSDFTDVRGAEAASVNSVTTTGIRLDDLERSEAPLIIAQGSDFGASENISKQQMAYTIVQSLGLQSEAQSFDSESPVVAIVFGEAVEVADSEDITTELKGYVQQALTLGLIPVSVAIEQGPFDLEPTITASFNPEQTVTRGELALTLSQLDNL
ncbi:S8 family serine peptidase [Aliiglaciecola sp. SL4]|uniref:S8 family serine peptidase n=1 Tax=Aliiglaciecola sp. SL4 TaxID=3239806 RepID=UPI00355BF3B3